MGSPRVGLTRIMGSPGSAGAALAGGFGLTRFFF